MSETKQKSRRVVFTGKQVVELESFDLPAPGEGEVCIGLLFDWKR